MRAMPVLLFTAFIYLAVGFWGVEQLAFANSKPEGTNEPPQVKVILERVYLDGDISEEIVIERIWSAEDFWAKYEDWKVVDMDEGMIIFRQQADDISPLLKANGYFGITEEGVLTIFNGKPDRTNIIQSFFPIDLGKLESTKCEELRQGIPVMTKDNYVEVLETFKTYSKDMR